jgi:hypothetical protein
LVDSKNTKTVIADIIAITTGQRNIKNQANIFQKVVNGTISQYQTVVIVTTDHHIVAGIELKSVLSHHIFSI